MSNNIEQQLLRLRPKGLSDRESGLMWSHIQNQLRIASVQSKRTFSSFSLFSKKAFSTLLILAIASSGWITVAYADNAAPGDFLFGLDLATEKVRLAIATPTKRTELELMFAEERLDEVESTLSSLIALANTSSRINYAPSDTEARVNDATQDEKELLALSVTSTSTISDTNKNETVESTNTTSSDEINESDSNAQVASSKNIERAHNTFTVALAHLDATRDRLLSSGDTQALAVLDQIIGRLSTLGDEYSEGLLALSSKTKVRDTKYALDIKTRSDELKSRFSLKSETSEDEHEVLISFSDNDLKTKIALESDGDISVSSTSLSPDKDKHGEAEKSQREKERKHDEDEADREKHKSEHGNSDDEGSFFDHFKRVQICHNASTNNPHTITVSKFSLKSHLKHGDLEGSCERGENATTTPDATPPVISNLNIEHGTSTATITLDTNEDSASQIWYSTSSPIFAHNPAHVPSSSSLKMVHQFVLANLLPETTYYFVITSADQEGNTATSTENTFTTDAVVPPSDTVAPDISNLIATSTTQSSAIISWNTNEGSQSTIWVSSSSPVDIGNSPALVNTIYSLTHSELVTDLTASTTYYYIVSATDSSNNTATSTQQSFQTKAPAE